MATQQEIEFDNWLCEKLKSLQLDEDIFLEYLKGVLEEDSPAEEKVETISGILEGATEEPISEDTYNEVIKKWNEVRHKESENDLVCNETSQALRADDKIREIMHKQQETLTVVKPIEKTDDQMKRRLLEQYSHVSENEDSDDEEKHTASKSSHTHDEISLFENVNAKAVLDQQKIQREKQKKASDDKKERDKQNREADKNKKLERQEKEKKRTQKGERRR
eukprot:Seg3671.1 transcript_id=Seg3671.1/GoldUCD/mRNA.D3Y31 product="Coiled-coil domain-containing protein 43" protein_id=Seg3671.1/GoldUCD/D3Y31